MISGILPLLIIWAVIAACFLGLLAYKAQLTRYEEDQLFLNDETESIEHQEQNEIVRKTRKLAPLIRVFGIAAAVLTVCIVGMYTYDAWQHLR